MGGSTITSRPVRFSKTASGEAPEIRSFTEANSQTFQAGELVYLAAGAAGGQCTLLADNGTLVLGIAMQSGTNVSSSNTEIPVEIIQPGDILIMYVTSDGATAALANTLYKGKSYGIDYVAAGTGHVVDGSDTTNDLMIFMGPVLDSAGSSTYYGYFQVEAGGIQAATGA